MYEIAVGLLAVVITSNIIKWFICMFLVRINTVYSRTFLCYALYFSSWKWGQRL